jgi:hypothetical protein
MPRLLRLGKEAPLRVNPEQAQAFSSTISPSRAKSKTGREVEGSTSPEQEEGRGIEVGPLRKGSRSR